MSIRIRVCRHPADLSAFQLFDLPHCLGTCSICPAPRRLKLNENFYGPFQGSTAERQPAVRLPIQQVVESRTDDGLPVPIELISPSGSHPVSTSSPR